MKGIVVNMKDNVEYDVYIGRGRDDIGFGNPIKFDVRCPVCRQVHRKKDRAELIECYRKWLWVRVNKDNDFRKRVKALHGQRLACWCSPLGCHGHVLLSAAQWLQLNDW